MSVLRQSQRTEGTNIRQAEDRQDQRENKAKDNGQQGQRDRADKSLFEQTDIIPGLFKRLLGGSESSFLLPARL